VKIVAISDIHGNLDDNLPSGDVLAISGDICPDWVDFTMNKYGESQQRKWIKHKFIPWCTDMIDSGKFQDVVFIAGNHDFVFLKPIRNKSNRFYIPFPEHVHYLYDSEVTIDGVRFYGTPWCSMFGSWAFMVDNEVLERRFAKIPDGIDVLLSHMPVKGFGDDVRSVNILTRMKTIEECGSKALLDNVLRVAPKLVCTGHLHDGSHRAKILFGKRDTTIVNVSVLDDDCIVMYAPFEFEV
jgi:Icc-related predicted phosphoesterase